MKDFDELMMLSPGSPYGVFTYYCDNLGDHIQTLALLQHVRPRRLVPRDHLTPQPDLTLMANGWLISGKLPQRVDFRQIKYVGVHIAPHVRTPQMIEALRPCGVIGCRDTATVEFLAQHGVPHHLTGCATLTFPKYDGKRSGVICVDVPPDILEKVRLLYGEPVCVSHDLDQFTLDQVNDEIMRDQYRQAYDLLVRYQTAELVITTRVHATLPCVALGTPVIYVGVSRNEDDRVTVFDGLGVKAVSAEELNQSPATALLAPAPIDAAPFRERYLEFLRRNLNEIEAN